MESIGQKKNPCEENNSLAPKVSVENAFKKYGDY